MPYGPISGPSVVPWANLYPINLKSRKKAFSLRSVDSASVLPKMNWNKPYKKKDCTNNYAKNDRAHVSNRA